jgi:hypothetical protein
MVQLGGYVKHLIGEDGRANVPSTTREEGKVMQVSING